MVEHAWYILTGRRPLLPPKDLDRKITAVFGKPWSGLNEQTAMLYGGIDSKEVTERAADPSGAMGAILIRRNSLLASRTKSN